MAHPRCDMGRRHHWPGQSRGAHLESRLLFTLSLPNQAIVLFGLIHLVNSFFWTPDHDALRREAAQQSRIEHLEWLVPTSDDQAAPTSACTAARARLKWAARRAASFCNRYFRRRARRTSGVDGDVEAGLVVDESHVDAQDLFHRAQRGLVSLSERPVFALNRQHVITLWEGIDVPCTGPLWQESAEGIERVDRASSARHDDTPDSNRPAGSILVGSHVRQVRARAQLLISPRACCSDGARLALKVSAF